MPALEAFVSNSFERHAIDFGEWIAYTSNARARARGHEGLRPGHNRVFVHLALTGSRVVDIAKAAGVSKNAIGQIVSELEELGYVERRADPTDGRAKRIHYTAKGFRLLADARQIGDEINAELAAEMGQKKFAHLRQLLAEAASHVAAAPADEH
jgi:DNA-binding MarR family transcriptional regulator